jgi:hypothetical protein
VSGGATFYNAHMPEESFRLRDVARYAPLPLIGGGLIGLAIAGFQWYLPSILHGALIGFTCFACAIAAERLLHRWLNARPEAWWRRAITYFFASQVGWPLGLIIGLPLIHGQSITSIRMPPAATAVIVITSVAGPLLGLAVYGYERLKERLRSSIEELKEKEFAEKELELARELQARMLPAPEIAADGYRISGRNFAARFVAGDFFDVFNYGDGSVGIVVADVAGKGLPASLIMASVKAVLPLLASTRSVEETMNALNDKLKGELSKREFVALVLARYDPASGTVSFVNAGLPDPYLIRKDKADPIAASGPRLPLGLKKSLQYEATRVALQPGDAILFLSDGLPEATATDGELLGYDRLTSILRQTGPRVDVILREVQAQTTDAREDDQTVVVLERAAGVVR